ncbi:complement C1q-like protein 2 [Takifugu flavidus]|nr:complement C1q-like protein 2 [Takifugu flavidus]
MKIRLSEPRRAVDDPKTELKNSPLFPNLGPPGLKSSKGEVLLSLSKINLMEVKVFTCLDHDGGGTEPSNIWPEVKALKELLAELLVKQTILETEVNNLKDELTLERTKVAFYAALTDSGKLVAPKEGLKLKYSKVFTNVGNAYDNTTGVFTAPVKGVYRFQFTAFGYNSCTIRFHVYKNNERIMNNWKHNQENVATYITNSFILELNEGDTVHFYVPPGACLYDDLQNYSTITGSLL